LSTTATFDDVKRALPLLTELQLKEIINRCKMLASKDLANDDWLLEGIVVELRLLGIPVPSHEKIVRLNNFKAYSDKSYHLRAALERQGIKTRTEKRQLAKICCMCLIEYLKGFTDVSLPNMLMFIDHIPQALERAFPGYWSNRMLPFVIGRSFPDEMVH
jgi:hypothetical protein